MSNLEMSFVLIGSVLTVGICFCLFFVLAHLAELAGQDGAVWPFFVTVAIGMVVLVLWCVLAEPLFKPVCINGHENELSAEYCIFCGTDLEPSCDCGYVWVGEDFCPKCGGAYEK